MSSVGTQVQITMDRSEKPNPNHSEVDLEAGDDEETEIWGSELEAESEPEDIPETGELADGSRRKTRTKYDKVANRTLKIIQGVIRTQRKLKG